MPGRADRSVVTPPTPAAVGGACFAIFLSPFVPSGFPEHRHTGHAWPYVADKPFGEDGFLMLTVGWNLGAGRGAIYNQGRTTTGIQPLSTAIDGVLAAIVQTLGGDKWTLTRAALLLFFLELVLLAFVIGKLAAEIAVRLGHAQVAVRASAFALVATLCSYALFRVVTFGLEPASTSSSSGRACCTRSDTPRARGGCLTRSCSACSAAQPDWHASISWSSCSCSSRRRSSRGG